jgi:hypothetical protein
MRQSTIVIAVLLVLNSGLAAAGKKVSVCHVPPGNPANAHTILVSENAVSAHLAHADELGECGVGCRSDASLCDDGNACTSDSCDGSGECAHAPVDCDDGNGCTLDRCDETSGCFPVANDGAACDDGNGCTSADACVGLTCQGASIPGCCAADTDCDDRSTCTDDACQDGSCSNAELDCGVTDKCLAGFCNATEGGCSTASVSCDDADACTDDGCDPATGCTHSPTETPPEAIEGSCPDTAADDCDGSAAAACRKTAATCADGADNDCDGDVDAADSECWFCGDGIIQTGVATPGTGCAPGQERSSEQCDDANENPFDGCDQCVLVDTTPD